MLVCSEGKVLLAGCWFVLKEKYCWLVADKPSEQGAIKKRMKSERIPVSKRRGNTQVLYSNHKNKYNWKRIL
jgi:phosphomevalonate kinase